jgi:hypothetical protein
MTGRPSANTRRLHLELGFLYDRDSLDDELPYWITIGATRHLVIPYSFETNDNRFDQNLGFSTGEDFARYMIDCFEVMYEEGAEHAKLMSLALHDRLTGRPGRITGLVKFLDHITARDPVWICTGREIGEHWRRVHPGYERRAHGQRCLVKGNSEADRSLKRACSMFRGRAASVVLGFVKRVFLENQQLAVGLPILHGAVRVRATPPIFSAAAENISS